jgi:uncharacterized protein (TIGR00661 family)
LGNPVKINNSKEKPLLLISPLDWGFGHTTRCIPIIRQLLESDCSVLVACNSKQRALLQPEFPMVDYLQLEGYNLNYSNSGLFTYLSIIFQIPKILIRIKRENRWLSGCIRKYKIDAVISDNRFGLYSNQVACVFITHQLSVKTGLGKIADLIIQKINYYFINRFSICWVPDFEGHINVAGALSHPHRFPRIHLNYLGCLSRFKKCTPSTFQYDLLVILSGPEPQRSILEKIIFAELVHFQGSAAVVRGVLHEENNLPSSRQRTIINYATTEALNALICASALVIGRAGYSTVMDLIKLKKKSVLIPTPGQMEQQYIAGFLSGKKLAYVVHQNNFSLRQINEHTCSFPFQYIDDPMEQYKRIIHDFVQTIN